MDSHISAVIQFILQEDALGYFHPDGDVQTYLNSVGPEPLPEKLTADGITVREILAQELEDLGGRSGLCHSIIQVNCWDRDYEEANRIRGLIKDLLLDNFTGPMGTLNVDSTNHDIDAELHDAERGMHQLITRIHVWFTSDAPNLNIALSLLVNSIREYDLSDQLPSSNIVLPSLPAGTFFQLFRQGILQGSDDYTRDGLDVTLTIPGILGERLSAAYIVV